MSTSSPDLPVRHRSDSCDRGEVSLITEKAFPMPFGAMLRPTVAVLAMALVVAACSGSGARSTGTSPTPARSAARNLLREEDLATSDARDAHHALQLLRPDWLRV